MSDGSGRLSRPAALAGGATGWAARGPIRPLLARRRPPFRFRSIPRGRGRPPPSGASPRRTHVCQPRVCGRREKIEKVPGGMNGAASLGGSRHRTRWEHDAPTCFEDAGRLCSNGQATWPTRKTSQTRLSTLWLKCQATTITIAPYGMHDLLQHRLHGVLSRTV